MIRAFSKTLLTRPSAISFATKAAVAKKAQPSTSKPKTAAKKKAQSASKPKQTKVKEESKTPHFIQKEKTYSTNNYSPLEVVIARAKGLYMTDVDGKRYMDFLAAYSAVN